MSQSVKSGDTTNREAVGAKIYWKKMFGKNFKRDTDDGGINALLNYGYAVLRASVARAICAAGLLPSFGIFHDNKLNPFCLADDFMEPFRPLVDVMVYLLLTEGKAEITSEAKKHLVDILHIKVKTTEGYSPLFQSLHYMCSSFSKALRVKKPIFDIPEWEGGHETLSDTE
jgi:CRISPR-associated protein Cas1